MYVHVLYMYKDLSFIFQSLMCVFHHAWKKIHITCTCTSWCISFSQFDELYSSFQIFERDCHIAELETRVQELEYQLQESEHNRELLLNESQSNIRKYYWNKVRHLSPLVTTVTSRF